MDVHTFAQLMPIVEGFPRPDWESIDQLLSQVPKSEAHKSWCGAARTWMEVTAQHLGLPYTATETENFLLLTPLDKRQVKLLATFVEKAHAQILARLGGIASCDGYGKGVVIVFDSQEAYYQYVAYFCADGEHPLSSGVFLNREYGHMAIPFYDLSETEATIAHELTHCCLRHLPIPLWLNEGLAVTIEDELCGNRPLRMDPARFAEHRAFWNEDTIQEFWSGRSFGRVDEGNSLSYELGRYCIRSLAHDLAAFTEFANQASFEDGGEAAASQVYEGSLGGLIEQFFGDGKWAPLPQAWQNESPENRMPPTGDSHEYS